MNPAFENCIALFSQRGEILLPTFPLANERSRVFPLGTPGALWESVASLEEAITMKRHTALTAPHRTLAERKARVEALVARGEVSAKSAAMIVWREPSPEALAYAKKLEPIAREILARGKRAAA